MCLRDIASASFRRHQQRFLSNANKYRMTLTFFTGDDLFVDEGWHSDNGNSQMLTGIKILPAFYNVFFQCNVFFTFHFLPPSHSSSLSLFPSILQKISIENVGLVK